MGLNYLKKEEGGNYTTTLVAPIFGKTSDVGDYYLNGVWYNSSGVAYAIPISYFPHIIECDIDGNVVEVSDFDVPDVVVNSINVKELTGLDKPLFQGHLPADITAINLIFPWTSIVDTHNAMNGGVYTAPKDGYYIINYSMVVRSTTVGNDYTAKVNTEHNGVTVDVNKIRFDLAGADGYCHGVTNLIIELTKGDSINMVAATLTTNCFIDGASTSITKLSIEFIGDKLNA